NYKPETHFVASSDGTTIQIYKLTTDPTTHPSSIRKEHWKNVATINTTAKDHQDVSLYDGLQFEDNHGRIEGRESLTMLAQHLAQLGFLVSPQGYCFHDVIEHEMFVELEIHYLRLNDLFCWSHHGVNQSLTTSWSRSELKQHVPEGGDKLMRIMTRYVTVRRERFEEFKRRLRVQREEIEDMKDKHDDELDNLKEQKNDAVAAKDKVQREKDKEINKKDEEIERLKREKDEEIKKKDEEIERLKRTKEEEIKKKYEEIERLKKEKDEEIKKKEEEIERLKKEKKDEKEELEKCQKQESWTFLPSTTKLVRANSETKQKYLERRQRVPPGTFALQTNFGFPYVSNSVNLVDNMSIWSMGKVDLVDEPESSIKEWPPLRTQYVRIGNGSAVDFDTSDWWYLKTTHPEGGLTMLVYYEHYKKIDI
ncbi:hypothetical protein LINPERPRIM_LOCUS39753, partial [Linum perenne]